MSDTAMPTEMFAHLLSEMRRQSELTRHLIEAMREVAETMEGLRLEFRHQRVKREQDELADLDTRREPASHEHA